MCSSVEDWLRSLGLIHYTQAFIDNGYDELEICKEIGREDLDAIGVTNFKDRTDILHDVERLKQSGTAVYFVLEGNDNSEPLQAQPERESYPQVRLKLMLQEKLEEDKISLTGPPYTRPDGSLGSVETLVTLYADKFYTYEEDVLQALLNLRQRQAATSNSICENAPPQRAIAPSLPARPAPVAPSNSVKHAQSTEEEEQGDERGGDVSEDEVHHEQTSPNRLGTQLSDFLDVESPDNRGKKVKKRRKVDRNNKLSRSLDSLKELHVNNLEVKPREREASSFKSKSFGLKWFSSSKHKRHASEQKKQVLEKKLSDQCKKDYDLLASAIKMSEEDRKTLMIMVKQGDLTVEEAVEQLKRYEEDNRPKGDSSPKGDLANDEDKGGNKLKLKRGIFGKSTKRKSVSRPTSEFVACEMTMSEDDRIILMTSVKNGDMSVDQALKRFISYEEKQKKSESDDSAFAIKPSHYMKDSPKLPKGSGFSRISIKRVSGIFSSSFKLPHNANEANSVFYTGEDGGSVDGSVSSGDEVLGTADSSPAPSPKRPLMGSQGLSKSQHSSSSSVESMEKLDERPESSPSNQKAPMFLSEMKVALASQTRVPVREGGEGLGADLGVDSSVGQEQKVVPICSKPDRAPPPHPDRKRSLPCIESQKVVSPPNQFSSLKKTPPGVPTRSGPTTAAPHRAPPPVPLRPKTEPTEDKSRPDMTATAEAKIKPVTKGIEVSPSDNENEKMVDSSSREDPPSRSLGGLKLAGVGMGEAVPTKTKHKPPPLPPRRPSSDSSSSSGVSEDPQVSEARSVETQTSPNLANSPVHKGPLKTTPSKVAPKGPQGPSPPSGKPQVKPKPKPKPRIKVAASQDKEDEGYHVVPPPRPVEGSNVDDPYHDVPPPRPIDGASSDDEAYQVPPTPGRRIDGESSDDEAYQVPPTPGRRINRESSNDGSYQVPPPRHIDGASSGKVSYRVPKPRSLEKKRYQVPPPRAVEAAHSDEGYHEVPLPRPVDGSPTAPVRTRGETSGVGERVNIEREGSAPLHPKITKPERRVNRQKSSELKASRDETAGASSLKPSPVPAPRVKRASHSLGEMVDRRLYIEQIDLTEEPYSDTSGCWRVPANLVDRYAEELHRSHEELAGIMDRIRVRKLKQAGRTAIPCDVSELDFTRDPLGELGSLSEWLTSLGLPMYIKSLSEVEYDDMDAIPGMEERHFQYAGIGDPRHMKRLLESVERMPR